MINVINKTMNKLVFFLHKKIVTLVKSMMAKLMVLNFDLVQASST